MTNFPLNFPDFNTKWNEHRSLHTHTSNFNAKQITWITQYVPVSLTFINLYNVLYSWENTYILMQSVSIMPETLQELTDQGMKK